MKRACIVDGYSAGNLLAQEFVARGVECVHIQSTKEIWPIFIPSYRPSDYRAHLVYDGDEKKLLEEITALNPLCVIPGTETGVPLADRLSFALALPNNGIEKSKARRHKYEMVETVRMRGLLAAAQILVNSVEEALQWLKSSGLSKVVVKPVESAGTDSVSICESEAQVREAFEKIHGKTNMLGLSNESVLVQEFLEGTEYFINTVSCEGFAYCTEIWEYQKRAINGRNCVYDKNELRSLDGEKEKSLRDYVFKVLEALEVQYGPAHTEVMWTPKGPVLVEIGTRLDGLSVPTVNVACTGMSAVELTVDAYLKPPVFFEKTQSAYHLKKKAYTVYLTSYLEGKVKSVPGESKIRSLDSFFQMRLRVQKDSQLKKTTDYFTAPGFVTLVHENPEQLEQDYQTIRNLEQGGLFEL